MDVASVAWLRCYTNEEGVATGERLIAETAAAACFNLLCSSRDGLYSSITSSRLEALWTGASERFLAPWIFGLSAHEEALLQLAQRTGKPFWALTEYGRGMGNIYTYTGGLGSCIPTGWSMDPEPGAGGIFRSIQRATRTGTDWRRAFAERCGVEKPALVRLWWFYSRKDDEKKHSFRTLGPEVEGSGKEPVPRRAVAKVIPIRPDGSMALAHEKTSGEKLAEQLFQAASDPGFKPNTDVTCAESAAGSAGQLSQFLWGILFDDSFTREAGGAAQSAVDIVVAPNLLTQWRDASAGGCVVADVTRLDLECSGSRREVPLPAGRRLCVCSTRIPRAEMRSFLEQCEERVFTTGDQSLAEAVLLGKVPCVRPDAKVQQWQFARLAQDAGLVEAVPDLGEELRRLVTSGLARDAARCLSKLRSVDVERRISEQLGLGPRDWSPTQQVLARAGMLG